MENGAVEQESYAEESEELALPDYNISTQPADYPLDVLWNKYKNKEIIIPSFQREYVWSVPQASKLIESFIKGLPVPPLYLYETARGRKLLVVDGIQRLLTVSSFLDGKLPGKNHEFRLQNMHERSGLHEKTFNDLEPDLQQQFKNSVLRCMIIRQWDPNDGGASMYQVFSRLNTGGTVLSPQEIRNCIYAGPLMDTISQLNKDKKWRKIYGTASPDKRKKDEQIILRYMALFHDGRSYKKPMVGFLNNFMKKNREADMQFLDNEKNRFQHTCNVIVKCLGKKPLHHKQTFHAALFDSVFIAFAKNSHSIPQNITERMVELKKDSRFQKAIEQRTSDEVSVKCRLERAESILFG